MDSLSQNALDSVAPILPAHSALEALGLSVRTRNALKGVGCSTVQDVLRLDLQTPIRGLGRKAKEELLSKLDDAGFSHPAGGQPSEIRMLERSLERMQQRVDAALGAVAKEIQSARAEVEEAEVQGEAAVLRLCS